MLAQKIPDNTSEATDEEDLKTLPSDNTFETARDTLKSVSPNYDFSKSEVDSITNSKGYDAQAVGIIKDRTNQNTTSVMSSNASDRHVNTGSQEILPSQPEHMPSLPPLDFTKLNTSSTKNNQEFIVTSVYTNPITQPQNPTSTGGSQKSMCSSSQHLGTPSSAGTPKTPSPRLRSLLNMAGYSSQDIQDASSPVSMPSQVKNQQDKFTSVLTPSSQACIPGPMSSSIALTSSECTKTSNNANNPLALNQVHVYTIPISHKNDVQWKILINMQNKYNEKGVKIGLH